MSTRSAFAAAAVLLLLAAPAHAQRPVCASLAPGERATISCRPFSLSPVVRFLADFSVDQLFKPTPPAFQRTALEMAPLFAAKEVSDDAALQKLLSSLPPLRFSQIDRSTGTVLAELGDSATNADLVLDKIDRAPRLAVRLPRVIAGGYWRGPDVLQIAFWENKRVGMTLSFAGGTVGGAAGGVAAGGDVDCVALSPEGLLVRFAPASVAPLLVLFRDCPQ
ncbi:MAG TPA: hypothetical protein VGK20_05555 [Candidatus Binatia bacterium]